MIHIIRNTALAAFMLGILQFNVVAQTFDLDFDLISVSSSSYQVKVKIRGSASFELGSANLRVNFNSSDLSNPVLVTAHNFNSMPYNSMTVTETATGVASVNITNIFQSGSSVSASPTWTDVATIGFTVTDANGYSNLSFSSTNASTYPTVVYRLSPTSTLSAGSLGSLNTSPLPVELISFSGYDRGDRVHLHWETATEFENYGFEIQRKEGDGQWTPIGFVPGKGTVNYPVVYDWDDMLAGLRTPRVFLDKLRYRLRQIDRDGTDDISPIVEVAMGAAPETPQLTVYPNPARGQTAAACVLQEQRNVTMTLHDAAGREVLRLLDAQEVPAGSHVYDLQTDQLPPGMYMLRMLAGGHVAVRNITVLK